MGTLCGLQPLKERYIRYIRYIPLIEQTPVYRIGSMYQIIRAMRYTRNRIREPMYHVYRMYRIIGGGTGGRREGPLLDMGAAGRSTETGGRG